MLFSNKIFSFLLISNFHRTFQFENSKLKTNFLTEFLEILQSPSILTAFLCWNNRENIQLIKAISLKSAKTIKILNLNNREWSIPEKLMHQNIFILDFDCDNMYDFLNEIENKNYFSAPYRWLIIGTNTTISIQNIYGHFISILPDSDVITVDIDLDNNFILQQPYKITSNSPIILENYGIWNETDGFVDNRNEFVLAQRRKNLNGTVLTASYVITHNDTLNHLDDYKYGNVDTITKHNYMLTTYLIESINAKKNSIFVNSWGYKQPNDTFYTGMIGNLQRKQADIGGTALFFTPDRVPIIEYIAPTSPTRVRFVFRQPPLSYVSNVYTLPFEPTVWLSQLCLIILITAILYLTLKWEKIKFKNVVETVEEQQHYLKADIGDVILISIGATCQQGSTIVPRGGPGRITMFILFLTLMFLYASFSAHIVALLQSSSNSIVSLKDLLNSRLQLGAEDIVYNRYYFKIATEPTQAAIYQQKIAPKGQKEQFMSVEEGVNRLRKGSFAFHAELSSLYKEVENTFFEHEKCGLMEIRYLDVINPWLAVAKRTPYMDIFKMQLRKIHERGLQSHEQRRLYTTKPICTGTGNSFSSVGLADIDGAFHIILVGLSTAVFIMLMENFYFRIKRTINSQRTLTVA